MGPHLEKKCSRFQCHLDITNAFLYAERMKCWDVTGHGNP